MALKIAELETEKAKAIAKEDFDEAKRIKIQIKNLVLYLLISTHSSDFTSPFFA